jgi:Uma2 family endonuclease
MSVVSIAEAWPSTGRAFTSADLDRMPDDGHRYEVLDGVLVVSPRPTTVHQVVTTRLAALLTVSAPDGLCVAQEPAVQLNERTEFDPDIAVVRQDEVGGAKFFAPPLLVAEVRSPSTAIVDLNRKKAEYERFGVASYWVVVPDREEPALIVFELVDGRYAEVAQVTGDEAFAAQRPFPVEIVPARLAAGLPRG